MPNKKMLINADQPEECRVVVIDHGKIADYIVEHAAQERIKGNVYYGVITRVEPSIEAAFVDYGGKKNGFLPFKEVMEESYVHTGEKKSRVRIQDVLFAGQKLRVQVVKEERESKGPTLTNFLTIPGRFLVLMSGSDATGVSRKIEDEEERKKLKALLTNLELPKNTGVIIRTAGLGKSKAELQKDLQMLQKVWETIETAVASDPPAPSLIYRGPDLVVRTVRDHFSNDTDEIVVDNVEAYAEIQEFFKTVMPRMQSRIRLYQEAKPLFANYRVEEQLDAIYSRRVALPSGGSVVIDVGEALVAIDVNSGKTTGGSELEDTALRTNLEAAEEIARQLRLRDLGGLIVIDFIDMAQKKNSALVEKEFKHACRLDKARINMARISKFGLMELSRQRLSSSVKAGAFVPCATCGGTGHIKSHAYIGVGMMRKIQEIVATGRVKVLEAVVSPEIVSYLLNHKTKALQSFQEKHGFRLLFAAQEGLTYDKFSFNILERKREGERPPQKPREAYREPMAAGEHAPLPEGDASVAEAGIEGEASLEVQPAPEGKPQLPLDGSRPPQREGFPNRGERGRRRGGRGRRRRGRGRGGQPHGNFPPRDSQGQGAPAAANANVNPHPQQGGNGPSTAGDLSHSSAPAVNASFRDTRDDAPRHTPPPPPMTPEI